MYSTQSSGGTTSTTKGSVFLSWSSPLLWKLGFGTCVPRPAAPVTHPKGRPKVTVALRQMTSIVECAGLAHRVGRSGVHRSREECEEMADLSPPSPLPPIS